nr:hypothetical protein [Erwinia sp. ErVv1]
MAGATQQDRDQARADWMKANPGKTPSDGDITGQVHQNFYNQAFTESGFGTGSALQQGIQAATAAVQGLAGGNIGQAISGEASPYLAEQIHKLTEGNPEAQAMAHAVMGAVTSYAAGSSALAGAAGIAYSVRPSLYFASPGPSHALFEDIYYWFYLPAAAVVCAKLSQCEPQRRGAERTELVWRPS